MSKERSLRQFETIFKTKTTLTKQKALSLANVIKGLLINPLSEEFREPLDWEQRGLINYDVIIQEPMDLSTIMESLKNETYSSVQDCLNDIELIFQNSRHYNRGTTWIQELTDKCEKAFFKLVKNYLPQIRVSLDIEKKSIMKAKKIKQKQSLTDSYDLHHVNHSNQGQVGQNTKIQQPNEQTAQMKDADLHSESQELLKLRTLFFDMIREASQITLQVAYLIIKAQDLSVINTQRNGKFLSHSTGNCRIDVKKLSQSTIVKLIQFLNEQKKRETQEMSKETMVKKKRSFLNEKSRYQI